MSETKNPLREWREENDISRDKLAQDLSIAYQTVYFWEAGRMNPGVNNLIKLAEYMGRDLGSLKEEWDEWKEDALTGMHK